MQRVAVITGSSSGIGRATALRLASDGYSVVLHAKANLAALQQVAAEIVDRGQAALCILADVAVASSRLGLVQAAFAWQGRVDVWVNNAGADVLTSAARDWDFQSKLDLLLATDLQGTIGLSRAVAERMRCQASLGVLPSMVNIGWDQAYLGMEGDAGQLFCTTKAAVMAFTSSLAMTVGPHVRVNCVLPGWIKTAWGTVSSDFWDTRAKTESLLERWGTAEDVAQVIAWLTHPASEFVNGQSIAVNGGRRFAIR